MELLNEFEQLEIIKEQFPNDYIIQEENMKDYLADISKSIIDSDNINYTFASLVSSYLSKSNFERFGTAYCDDTTVYASDKGDCFTFFNNRKKGINTLKFQSANERVRITLKTKKDKAFIERVIVQDDHSTRITKSEFEMKDGKYYQKYYSDKLSMCEDSLTTIGNEVLYYDIDKDEMIKSYSMVTKNDTRVISKSNISTVMNKNEYVIEDGIIHIVNVKEDLEIIKKAKKLENKLVNKKN